MSEKELRDFIIKVAKETVKIFEREHEVDACYLVDLKDRGIVVVPPPPVNKDAAAFLMRKIFATGIANRYVYVSEAWALVLDGKEVTKEQKEYYEQHGLSQHPDRTERVMYSAEDGEMQIFAYQEIIRSDNSPPRLGKLEFDSISGVNEGRLVGMMPRKGMKQ